MRALEVSAVGGQAWVRLTQTTRLSRMRRRDPHGRPVGRLERRADGGRARSRRAPIGRRFAHGSCGRAPAGDLWAAAVRSTPLPEPASRALLAGFSVMSAR